MQLVPFRFTTATATAPDDYIVRTQIFIMRGIVMSASVCLFVCPLAYLENRTDELQPIFVHGNCGRGSVLLWRCCVNVIYFRFCGCQSHAVGYMACVSCVYLYLVARKFWCDGGRGTKFGLNENTSSHKNECKIYSYNHH